MAEYDVAVIGGDGIGPEVTREAMKVLDAASEVYGFQLRKKEYPFGTDHYLAHDEIFPDAAFDEGLGLLDIGGDAASRPN